MPFQSRVLIQVGEVLSIDKLLRRRNQDFVRAVRMSCPAIKLWIQAIDLIEVGVCKFGDL